MITTSLCIILGLHLEWLLSEIGQTSSSSFQMSFNPSHSLRLHALTLVSCHQRNSTPTPRTQPPTRQIDYPNASSADFPEAAPHLYHSSWPIPRTTLSTPLTSSIPTRPASPLIAAILSSSPLLPLPTTFLTLLSRYALLSSLLESQSTFPIAFGNVCSFGLSASRCCRRMGSCEIVNWARVCSGLVAFEEEE